VAREAREAVAVPSTDSLTYVPTPAWTVVATSSKSGAESLHPANGSSPSWTPDWGEIFGDTVVAAAILDRLMHNAVVFNIKGPSSPVGR